MSRISTIEQRLNSGEDCVEDVVRDDNGFKLYLPFCTVLMRKNYSHDRRPLSYLANCTFCPYYRQSNWQVFWEKIECPD